MISSNGMGPSSLFLILVAVYPLPLDIHFYVSVPFFIFFPLSLLIINFLNFKSKHNFKRKMSYFAFLVFLIAVIFSVFLLVFDDVAIPEELVVFPGFIWYMIFGFGIISNVDI